MCVNTVSKRAPSSLSSSPTMCRGVVALLKATCGPLQGSPLLPLEGVEETDRLNHLLNVVIEISFSGCLLPHQHNYMN